MPEPQETWDPTGPVKRKSQFSIRNLFLWTTIVSVGVVITTASSQRVAADFGGGLGPVEQGFLVGIVLSIYIMAVCGTPGAPRAPLDADLRTICDAWPTLSAQMRAALLAMVKASGT